MFLQNDAHGFTDHFARVGMSARVDLEGKPSKYFLQNIGINTYPRVSHARMSNVLSFFVLIKTIEAIFI